MRCEQARVMLHAGPEGLDRLRLRVHLWRCAGCRAEAEQVRALEEALHAIQPFAPPHGLLEGVLRPVSPAEGGAARKESNPMRQAIYAAVALVIVGVVLGIFASPGRRQKGNLLLSVAQAMESADTVYALVHGGIAGYYPAMSINKGYDEYWYSPGGFRWDSYLEDGTLWRTMVGRVEEGVVWMIMPPLNTTIRYDVGPAKLGTYIELSRKQFVDADLRLDQIEEQGHPWTARDGTKDGRPVTIIEEDLGPDLVSGKPQGTVYYYIDSAAGRLTGLEQYTAGIEGRQKVAEIEDIEYGTAIPADTFSSAPYGEVVEGTFEAKEDGYIVFSGMGRAADYDPRATTLFDRAQAIRHWVSMGVLPWEDVENAYLAVLKQDPKHGGARMYLGRIYTRWGRFEEALDLLPAGDGYWSDLNRAFCYDALGRRAEALALYREVAGSGHDSVSEWAKLGLMEPTWPTDLPIGPREGEKQLTPATNWHASASSSAFHGEPSRAIDGNRDTRWTNGGSSNGAGQEPGQWFELSFGQPLRASRVVLDHHGIHTFYTNDWPRGLTAAVTEDGQNWRPVAVSAAGPMRPSTVQLDPAQSIRAIRFESTKDHDPEWWSIFEVFVFGPEQ